ncbi:MAG: UPF0175 family protein [Bacteroidetes bacterium]|jgi:predicted HTH domain antitoxin|nr:UPF0175 family protein [Bacteroidota bacterium]
MIYVSYPESLANSLKLNTKDFVTEIKMSSLAKLFELGRISSGTAAKILGISRVEFLDRISDYKISIFNHADLDDLNNDISNA